MWLDAAVLLVLVLLNGAFALSEIAIVSSRRARLQALADEGVPGADTAVRLVDEPNRLLATVQVGISLVGVGAGAYGGARFAAPLAELWARWGWTGGDAVRSGVAYAVVVLTITYLTLVLGELVPKRWALVAPERIAARVAPTMAALARLVHPIVVLLGASTTLVLRLLRVRDDQAAAVSEEEVEALIAEGIDAGVFEEGERALIANVFDLSERTVADAMTPRPRLRSVPVDADAETLRVTLAGQRFTRWLVTGADRDDVLGFVHARDVLEAVLTGEGVDLGRLVRPARYVPESASLLDALEAFRDTGDAAALVVDEHGDLAGIVTFQDVIDDLVGTAPERATAGARRRGDGSWSLSGSLGVDELREVLGLDHLPYHARARYRTVAGLMATLLARVPAMGDAVEVGRWRFVVEAVEGRRASRVLAVDVARRAGTRGGGA